MAKSGLKHIDVGPELTKTEWESEDSHELIHGSSFPGSPVERQLFYRDDEHKWYIYNGSEWVWLGGGSGGGMQVHGNEYHDPDFEQQGVAASLVETHRTSQTHTQPQPPAEHGNEKHDPDFATEAALASHASAATGVHGVGGSTVESASGSQSKVDTHAALTTGVHTFDKSCRVTQTSAQSIPHATATMVAFNSENWDTDNIHDNVTNNTRLTCKTAGKYVITGFVRFVDNTTGVRIGDFYLNGGTIGSAVHGIDTGGRWSAFFFQLMDLAVNDYVELAVYQTSGGALSFESSQLPKFGMARIA